MSETKQKWCENCGELDEDDEDSWEHYQSYLKRKNSTKPAFRFISGGGCHNCGMSLCQKCIEGDTTFNGFEPTCEECGYAFCGDCKDDMEDRCNPCQEEYEDSICDCCGYACGNKNAETSGQWEIGEQLEEAQMNAEGKKKKKLSGVLSDPFDELSLDSGDWKSIVIGFGVGLLGLFGYSKLRK
tara:strand:- start:25 stop:576 length:552 start_codon:yes stop_codon:yes gene_type:complete